MVWLWLQLRIIKFAFNFGFLSLPPWAGTVIPTGTVTRPFFEFNCASYSAMVLSCVSSLRFENRRSRFHPIVMCRREQQVTILEKSIPSKTCHCDMAPAGPRKPRCTLAHRRCASEARSAGVDLNALIGEIDCTANDLK